MPGSGGSQNKPRPEFFSFWRYVCRWLIVPTVRVGKLVCLHSVAAPILASNAPPTLFPHTAAAWCLIICGQASKTCGLFRAGRALQDRAAGWEQQPATSHGLPPTTLPFTALPPEQR